MNEKMLPLLKWAGGKRKIARKIIDLIDHDLQDGTYFEPFLGGGAVLFELLPNKAVCFDYNRDLIEFYNVVKSKPEKLIRVLDKNIKIKMIAISITRQENSIVMKKTLNEWAMSKEQLDLCI